jgi:hypothetical protein
LISSMAKPSKQTGGVVQAVEHLLCKNDQKRISQLVQLYTPVVPAPWEAEKRGQLSTNVRSQPG